MSIVVYFFVGGISFLGNLSIFLTLVRIVGLNWIGANPAGFVGGTLINYVLSARFVFERKLFSRRKIEIGLVMLVESGRCCDRDHAHLFRA